MSTPTVQGTTTQVLACYGAHKLQLHSKEGLFNLVSIDFEAQELYATDAETGRMEWTFHPSEVLPVLRPFNQLCTPLEDGTVPAVRLAELHYQQHYPGAYAEPHDTYVLVYWPMHGLPGAPVLTIHDDWTVTGLNMLKTDVARLADQLRAWHFAVGLSEGQYIPKEAAPTP